MNNEAQNEFVGYEYQDITVKQNLQTIYADSYTNFGWALESATPSSTKSGSVDMKFKRDRKISNKAELSRLQRQFDACVEEIQNLEFSKSFKAAFTGYGVGIGGTAFMAGSVFAYLGSSMPLTILLAIPGFIGWGASYFTYANLRGKKSEEVAPLIDRQYDEIYAICEKANALLG